ncbi:hypothetical protein DITRI_Ditri14bG0019600 [Diplodiscus trichospermus]
MNRVSTLKFLHPIETTTNCRAEQVKTRNHNSGPYDDRWHAVASWTWDAQDEHVEFVGWLSMVAVLTANSLGMIAH